MTANLKAPLVINLVNRRAAQVILEDFKYPLRHLMNEVARVARPAIKWAG